MARLYASIGYEHKKRKRKKILIGTAISLGVLLILFGIFVYRPLYNSSIVKNVQNNIQKTNDLQLLLKQRDEEIASLKKQIDEYKASGATLAQSQSNIESPNEQVKMGLATPTPTPQKATPRPHPTNKPQEQEATEEPTQAPEQKTAPVATPQVEQTPTKVVMTPPPAVAGQMGN